jgi:glycosyltransferase involved in cell wall biosynthesis
MKRIVCSVTTDLNYDQRMIRICTALSQCGFSVTLVGRKRPHSKPFGKKPYEQVHLNGFFESGFLFYAEYNIRLFFYLLRNKFDIYNACDLDTILPCTFIAMREKAPLVYDAHEYFTEQEEIVDRPFVKNVWKRIERFCVPMAKQAYTVSVGYARLFAKEYTVPFEIVRNVTQLREPLAEADANRRASYILYQGAVNEGRGLYELILAMKDIPDYQLKICGLGDIHEELVELVKKESLTNRIEFLGYVEPEKLRLITSKAAMGITLFADGGLSHKYSLANRFFDYMHAGMPQLAMDYPEYQNFNQSFEVAHLIPDIDPKTIATGLKSVLDDEKRYLHLANQASKARLTHNFTEDANKLCSLYHAL